MSTNCAKAATSARAGESRNGEEVRHRTKGYFEGDIAMRRLIVTALAAMICLLLGTAARAQRLDGTLRVTVTDNSQASIEEAKVTVQNEATGVAVTTSASSAGTYVFPNLLVGTYTVSVEKDGFKKAVQKGVTVASNQVAEAKVQLELGSVSATVEVEAGADLVKTESSTLEATFSGRVVQDIPINTTGGDVKEYSVYAPGTTTQQGGVLGSGGSIGGTRPRFNGFSIDGVDDNKIDTNGPTQPVIQESVAEFTLLTNQFTAENGHSAGGQFNIVTKSGTNNWHGAGWGYNRNRNYDAFDNLQKQRGLKDRFDYNRAGASAGGPIVHNKFFVYGAYEFQNNGLASSSPTFSSPTADGLATLTSLAHDSAVSDILSQFPVAATADSTVVVNGQAIPVGTIQSIAPNFANQHDFIVNADLSLGKHQLRGRFLYDRFRAPDFNPSQPQAQFLGTNSSDARKVIFTDAWSIANNVINDFRTSYSRLNGPNLVVPSGFQNFPNVEVDELGSNLGPNGLAPQGYAQNVYQWVDNISYIRGKHTFKFGVEARKYISPTNTLPRARGEWDYASLSQFINDFVPTGANGALRGAGSGSVAENYNAFYWFVQDDWKITPRLTLNLGLRYEYSGVPRDENLQAINGISDDPALGLTFRAPKPDTNNFMPRFGFAWDVFGNGKTSLRGGYGLGWNPNFGNVTFNVIQNPPNYSVIALTAGSDVPTIPITTDNSGPLAGSGGTKPIPRVTLRAVDPNIKTEYAHLWSAALEHQFGTDLIAAVEYTGSKGVNLYSINRLNIPGSAVVYGGPGSGSGSSTDRINNQYSYINFRTNGGFSNYNALNVRTEMRNFRRQGVTLRFNYTWAHAIDNISNTFSETTTGAGNLGVLDPLNPGLDKGDAEYDVRHRVTLAAIWEVGYRGKNRATDAILGGWSIIPNFSARTGIPFTVWDCTHSKFVLCPRAMYATPFHPVYTQTPTTNANEFNYMALGTPDSTYKNPNVDVTAKSPGASDFGPFPSTMTGRDAFRAPGVWTMDFAIHKNFNINERFKLQLRGEAFNVFNHSNLYLVYSNTDLSSTSFITATRGVRNDNGAKLQITEDRNLQLALKLLF